MTAIALGRGALLFERNWMVYRRTWMIIFSGLFEPLFYLASMGIGLGHYVPHVDVEIVATLPQTAAAASRLLPALCWD